MEKYKSMFWEIFFLALASLMTLGISIKSVIDKNDEEKKQVEFRKTIEELTEKNSALTKEIDGKADSIRILTEQLKEQAKLNSLQQTNPIPKTGKISFMSRINLQTSELESIFDNLSKNNHKGFSLKSSIDIAKTQSAKLEKLFNGEVFIRLKFSNESNFFEIKKVVPFKHVEPYYNRIYILGDSMHFDLTNIDVSDTDITSSTSTLYDLQYCKLEIMFEFFERDLDPSSIFYGYAGGLEEEYLNIELTGINFQVNNKEYIIQDFEKSLILNRFVSDFVFKIV